MKNWTHLTHLKTSLEPVDNEAQDLLETCQEDFRFVRIQLTNFQQLVASQIFEDLFQESKVPQSLQNQFEENWDVWIALDLGLGKANLDL